MVWGMDYQSLFAAVVMGTHIMFPFFAFADGIAINILTQIFLFLWDVYLRVGSMGQKQNVYFLVFIYFIDGFPKMCNDEHFHQHSLSAAGSVLKF